MMRDDALAEEESIAMLAHRRNHKPVQIDNASLVAGDPMYFYCTSCGWPSDMKHELYRPELSPIQTLCEFCRYLKDRGWLK